MQTTSRLASALAAAFIVCAAFFVATSQTTASQTATTQPASPFPTSQPVTSSPPATQPAAPAFVLDKRILVMLVAGDNKTDMTPEQRMDIQKQHMAHLTKMWEQGHMVVAGPVGNQSDKRLRGLCLYRIPDGDPSGHLDQVRALAESDPAVQAGVLKVEVMVWYFEKDSMTFKYEGKKND